jgi:outer membrane protein assembly factor BamB
MPRRSAIPISVGTIKRAAVILAACALFSLALSSTPAGAKSRPSTQASTGSIGWPFFGFDAARTSYNPYESLLSPANVAGLTVRWSRAVSFASPVITRGGTLIVPGGGRLLGLDPATGATLWRTWSFGPGFAALAHGEAYVADGSGTVRAFNVGSGAKVWASSSGTEGQQIDAAPVVANGLVYLAENDPELIAMDASSGALAWASAARSCYFAASSPAVVNGVDYIEDDCGTLWALDASTGRVQWHASVSAYGPAFTPVVGRRFLYTSSTIELGAFDPSTGARVWAVPLSGGFGSVPAVARGVVYVDSGDGTVSAFGARTGRELWSASTGPSVVSSLAVANGVLYVASNKLYAFDAATGSRLLAKRIGANDFLSDPVVANGSVYVHGSDWRLYALTIPTPSNSSSP